MTAIVNEQTSYFLKTGGFDYVECSDHIIATHRDSNLTIRINAGDMPTDIVNKLIAAARSENIKP